MSNPLKFTDASDLMTAALEFAEALDALYQEVPREVRPLFERVAETAQVFHAKLLPILQAAITPDGLKQERMQARIRELAAQRQHLFAVPRRESSRPG